MGCVVICFIYYVTGSYMIYITQIISTPTMVMMAPLYQSMSMQKTSVQTPDNERDRFANRIDFYFAAVGSAVGFGNVWR